MKNSKKIAATLLASAMMFGSATVLAAPGDLYKVSDPSKVFMSADDYMDADDATKNMIGLKAKEYYIQLGDKLYKLSALRKLYATHKADYHKHLNEVPAADQQPAPVETEELEVIDISKITTTEIHVNFKKLDRDMKGVTLSVKKGDQVFPVTKRDINKDMEKDIFQFEAGKGPAAEDLKGIWTVNGIEYDFEKVAAGLQAVNDAADADTLLQALKDFGIKEVKDEYKAEYFAKMDTPVYEDRFTVQLHVYEVNEDQLVKPAREAADIWALKKAFDDLKIEYQLELLNEYIADQSNWHSLQNIRDSVKKYNDLTEIKQANDAMNIFDLAKAFETLKIDNVKTEYMPDYLAVRPGAGWKNKAEIQKTVDDVNKEREQAATEAKLVQALIDLAEAENYIAIDNLLRTDKYKDYTKKYNRDWLASHYTYQFKTLGTSHGLKGIQEKIYYCNDLVLAVDVNLGIPLNSDKVDEKKVKAAKEFIEKWAKRDDSNNITGTHATTKMKLITKNYELLINLRKATTAAEKKAALEALNDEDCEFDKTNKVTMTKFEEENAEYYDFSTIDPSKNKAGIDILLDTGNNAPKTKFLTPINQAAASGTADDLYNALKAANDKGYVFGVIEAVKAQYFTDKAKYEAGVSSDFDSLQTEIDKSNLTYYVTGASKISTEVNENDFWTKLSTYHTAYKNKPNGFKNELLVANKSKYFAAKGNMATNLATVDGVIKEVNETVLREAYVAEINKADATVATVQEQLDKLADLGEVTDYLTVEPEDRDFIAKYVLKHRPGGGYVNVAAVEGEVSDAKTAHTTALSEINAIRKITAMNDVVTALKKLLNDAFEALSPVQKVNVADKFMDLLEKDPGFDDNTGHLNKRLTTVKHSQLW